jgi:hypothetical protein
LRKDATWPADRVDRWPLAKLVPAARNARTHSDEQVTQLAASIEEWGWTIPVLVDEAGGIIAGHGRVMAAHRLGLEDVPVMVAAGWSESKKRAYMLADNKLTLNGEWDLDRLAIEIAELRASDFDISLIGFNESEIDDLLKADGGGLTDPEEAPEPPADPVSKIGDVWLLGKHRLVCGDCTDAEAVANLCSGVVPDLANCDQPYGVSIVKGASYGGANPLGSADRTDIHVVAFGKIGGGKPHPYAGAKQGRVHGPAKRAIIKPGIYAPIIGDDSTATAIAAYAALVELGVPAIVLWGGNYFANQLPPSRCWLVWDKENIGSFADAEAVPSSVVGFDKGFRARRAARSSDAKASSSCGVGD